MSKQTEAFALGELRALVSVKVSAKFLLFGALTAYGKYVKCLHNLRKVTVRCCT